MRLRAASIDCSMQPTARAARTPARDAGSRAQPGEHRTRSMDFRHRAPAPEARPFARCLWPARLARHLAAEAGGATRANDFRASRARAVRRLEWSWIELGR